MSKGLIAKININRAKGLMSSVAAFVVPSSAVASESQRPKLLVSPAKLIRTSHGEKVTFGPESSSTFKTERITIKIPQKARWTKKEQKRFDSLVEGESLETNTPEESQELHELLELRRLADSPLSPHEAFLEARRSEQVGQLLRDLRSLFELDYGKSNKEK